jgi:hypothetical protein
MPRWVCRKSCLKIVLARKLHDLRHFFAAGLIAGGCAVVTQPLSAIQCPHLNHPRQRTRAARRWVRVADDVRRRRHGQRHYHRRTPALR